MNAIFRKQIAIPQDHGSWVFIFSPLLIGIFAAKGFHFDTVILVIAALAAFLFRQPLTMIVKILSGRRPRADLPAALLWAALYSVVGLVALLMLVLHGNGYVAYLAVPGVPVFAWHLWLVSRRAERKQAGVEVIATGVLALAAPGAYWVGLGRYDPTGWWLWLLAWLQSAASIMYAYLRLEQRVLHAMPDRGQEWRMARRALFYTTFNFLLAVALGIVGLLPGLIFVPYLVQWLESIWGAFHPAVRVKPVFIGVRQLVVSLLWTVLFIVVWNAAVVSF